MDTSLEWMTVIGQRRFTRGHHMVGGEVEDCNNHERAKSDRFHDKQKDGKS